MEGVNQQISSLDNADDNKNVSMAAKTFAAKFRSKREVWNFLAVDVGAYLPPYENVTIYHMKDLVTGTKKVCIFIQNQTLHFQHLFYIILQIIKANEIKVLHVPQYETLTVEKILGKAKTIDNVAYLLPDKDEETAKFTKSYICNLVYTVVGEDFKAWVKEQINSRNEIVATKQKLLVNMDAEIANAFYKSTHVSQ